MAFTTPTRFRTLSLNVKLVKELIPHYKYLLYIFGRPLTTVRIFEPENMGLCGRYEIYGNVGFV